MIETPTGLDIFDYDNPEWGRQFILQLRYNLPPETHDHMQAIGRTFVNGHLKSGVPPGNASAQDDASALSRDGFLRLGKVLGNEQIMESRAHFEPMLLMGSWLAEEHPRTITSARKPHPRRSNRRKP